jgi:hypothetical protein
MRAICDGDQSRTTAADLEGSNMRARAARARRARARSGIFERKYIRKRIKSNIHSKKNLKKKCPKVVCEHLFKFYKILVGHIETENLENFSKLETKIFCLSNRDSTIAQKTATLLLKLNGWGEADLRFQKV